MARYPVGLSHASEASVLISVSLFELGNDYSVSRLETVSTHKSAKTYADMSMFSKS